ncbi:hypothetical protein [Cryobacterium zhongshanensis]|uniref:Uncharacterized protein n=1 Tax=Cryobacterium zhongshanensis TaxID=2928153 RepID=A0AA41QTD9_9MICO|nr:hypothetical protein [Cryobacterium zhongshanensis]MCI4657134.1 hypothetical protein [Cryobacterium zhongshanensis]
MHANLSTGIDDLSTLGQLSRWGLGVAGFMLTAAGCVAVFIANTNVAGVPLLIILGAAFLYVAATGQQLLQVNRDGLVLAGKYARTLEEVVEDPATPDVVRENLFEVAAENGIEIRRGRYDSLLERAVGEELSKLGVELGFTVADHISRRGREMDFLLSNLNDGARLPVEVKSASGVRDISRAIRQLEGFGFGEGLLIVDGSVDDRTREMAASRQIGIVSMRPESDFRSAALKALSNLSFISGTSAGTSAAAGERS